MINIIKKHKYIFIFLFIFICFLPYFLHYYPGIIISDTYPQLRQALGTKQFHNHHPVFQTLFWCIFVKIGKFFNNDNIIVAINSIMQMIVMAGIFTYSIYFLDKKKIKSIFLVIFYALYPVFGIYSIYTTKDTMFSICILFFMIELCKILDKPENTLKSKKDIFLLILSSILVILYKNNGIYIILGTYIVLLIYFRKYFKKMIAIFATIISLFLLWNNVIFKMLGVEPTEKVESLGIPLEQINYIVYEKFNELDEETLKRIDNFISTDLLKEIYVPQNIDSIKKQFNEEYYNEHKLEFFKLSFDLLIKYPKESWASIWNKNSRIVVPYTYVGMVSIYIEDRIPINVVMEPIVNIPAIDFIYNKVLKYRLTEIIKAFLFHPTVNFYILILFTIYSFVKKKKDFILSIPMFLVWFTTFAAPSCLYRYVFPTVMCMPFILYYTFNIENKAKNILVKASEKVKTIINKKDKKNNGNKEKK